MISRAAIKANAKAQLGNNLFCNIWLMALVVSLVYSIIIGAAGMTYAGVIILMGPMGIGLASVFMSLARGFGEVKLEQMFTRGFSEQFGRNLLLGFLRGLFTALWSMLFVVPGIVKHYSYSMSFYVAADHPEYTWNQCMDESKRMTAGHKGELFVLDLSFIGWSLLCSLTLGILSIWIMPYMQQTDIGYFEAIKRMSGIGSHEPEDDGQFHSDDRFDGGHASYDPER